MKSPKNYRNIVVLTGAGISAESGIQTFRAEDGLWENHKIEDVATPEAFIRNPVLVHRFYNERRQHLLNGIEPNMAHLSLGQLSLQLEESRRGKLTLITQNIDDLHQRSVLSLDQGQNGVLPMHGELLKIRCQQSGQLFHCEVDTSIDDLCPCCQQAGNLRPHIVWFGEMPQYMNEIEHALSQCDLFVAIGTSGNVYPAAGFFEIAQQFGAHTVELNLEPSQAGSKFSEQHYGLATQVVPDFFQGLSFE
jgi:NAD-dependent deacetylase